MPTDGSVRGWPVPSAFPTLATDVVDVWGVAIDGLTGQVPLLFRSLASEERDRAERFHFQADRDRFIVARGVLRAILGRYLACDPDQVPIAYSAYGKPLIGPDAGVGDLQFNLSHAGGIAVYAVAHRRPVGIDIEVIDPALNYESIAAHHFAPVEAAVLRSLPADLQVGAFFAAWTRKEAYLKARGEGLFLPLDYFEVSLEPWEPPALLGHAADPDEVLRWSLRDVLPAAGYAGALAAAGREWRPRFWQWPGSA